MIERFARNHELTAAERKELRLEHALPILNDLGKWMAEHIKQTLPKSPLGEALQYTIPRWDNLLVYLYDGHLEIDNNLVENAIRPSIQVHNDFKNNPPKLIERKYSGQC